MKKVNPENKIEVITRQVQMMLDSFDGHYETIDYKKALDYFIQFKKQQLSLTESILSVQDTHSPNHKVMMEKSALLKDSIDGLTTVSNFIGSVLSSTYEVKPLTDNTVMVASYSLMLDLNDFHTFKFDFENGDPVLVAVKHASLKERLDQIRAFLGAL